MGRLMMACGTALVAGGGGRGGGLGGLAAEHGEGEGQGEEGDQEGEGNENAGAAELLGVEDGADAGFEGRGAGHGESGLKDEF